jgi:hypothetical protein
MSVRVLAVSGMPHNVDIWLDDSEDDFMIYIDRALITDRGAMHLERVLRRHAVGWQRLDQTFVRRTLRAITG